MSIKLDFTGIDCDIITVLKSSMKGSSSKDIEGKTLDYFIDSFRENLKKRFSGESEEIDCSADTSNPREIITITCNSEDCVDVIEDALIDTTSSYVDFIFNETSQKIDIIANESVKEINVADIDFSLNLNNIEDQETYNSLRVSRVATDKSKVISSIVNVNIKNNSLSFTFSNVISNIIEHGILLSINGSSENVKVDPNIFNAYYCLGIASGKVKFCSTSRLSSIVYDGKTTQQLINELNLGNSFGLNYGMLPNNVIKNTSMAVILPDAFNVETDDIDAIELYFSEINNLVNKYLAKNVSNNEKNLIVASLSTTLIGNDTRKLFEIYKTVGYTLNYSVNLNGIKNFNFDDQESSSKVTNTVKFLNDNNPLYIGNISLDKENIGTVARNIENTEADLKSTNAIVANFLLNLIGVNEKGSFNKNCDHIASILFIDAVQMITNRMLDHSRFIPPTLISSMYELTKSILGEKGTFSNLLFDMGKKTGFSYVDNIKKMSFNYVNSTLNQDEIDISQEAFTRISVYGIPLYTYIRSQTEPLNILLSTIQYPNLLQNNSKRSNPRSIEDLGGYYGTLVITDVRKQYLDLLHRSLEIEPLNRDGHQICSVTWSTCYEKKFEDCLVDITEVKEEVSRYLDYHDAGLFKFESDLKQINNKFKSNDDEDQLFYTSDRISYLKSMEEANFDLLKAISDFDSKTGAQLILPTRGNFEGCLQNKIWHFIYALLKSEGALQSVGESINGCVRIGAEMQSVGNFGPLISGQLPTQIKDDPKDDTGADFAKSTVCPTLDSKAFEKLIENPTIKYNIELPFGALNDEEKKIVKANYNRDDIGDEEIISLPKQSLFSKSSRRLPLGQFKYLVDFTNRDASPAVSLPSNLNGYFRHNITVKKLYIPIDGIAQVTTDEDFQDRLEEFTENINSIFVSISKSIESIDFVDCNMESVDTNKTLSKKFYEPNNQLGLTRIQNKDEDNRTQYKSLFNEKVISRICEGNSVNIDGVTKTIADWQKDAEFRRFLDQCKDRINKYRTDEITLSDLEFISKYGSLETYEKVPEPKRLAYIKGIKKKTKTSLENECNILPELDCYLEIQLIDLDDQVNLRDGRYTLESENVNDPSFDLLKEINDLVVKLRGDESKYKAELAYELIEKEVFNYTTFSSKQALPILNSASYLSYLSILDLAKGLFNKPSSDIPKIFESEDDNVYIEFFTAIKDKNNRITMFEGASEKAIVEERLSQTGTKYGGVCIASKGMSHYQNAMEGKWHFINVCSSNPKSSYGGSQYDNVLSFIELKSDNRNGFYINSTHGEGNKNGFESKKEQSVSFLDRDLASKDFMKNLHLEACSAFLGFIHKIKDHDELSSPNTQDQSSESTFPFFVNKLHYLITGKQISDSFDDYILKLTLDYKARSRESNSLFSDNRVATPYTFYSKLYNFALNDISGMAIIQNALKTAYPKGMPSEQDFDIKSVLEAISNDDLKGCPQLDKLLCGNLHTSAKSKNRWNSGVSTPKNGDKLFIFKS